MASSGSFNTSGYNGRYLTFSWTEKSQSIPNNTTTIEWTLKGAGAANVGYYNAQNIKVTINGDVVFSRPQSEGQIELYDGTIVASGTYTFTHKADGTQSFTAYAEAGIYAWAVNCTGTQNFTLDTIPRASSLTAANGTLGTGQTLKINAASTTFKHRLTYKCGDVSDYIAGSATTFTTQTSILWGPPIGLAHENTTGTSVSITLTLYTYDSTGNHIGTTEKTISCAIPVSVKPSCSIAWEDVSGAYDLYGACVQGISKLKITLTEQTSYSSPIASRSISANGVKYTTQEATTGVLKTAGSNTINATVKDQRERTGSDSETVTVWVYSKPTISSLSVHRCDEDGTENDQGDHIQVTFSANIQALTSKNSAAYKLRYKASTATNYTEIELTDLNKVYTVTDYSLVIAADGSNSYDVEIVATDNHGTATRATSASTAFTLMNWNAKGNGMGIGKVSEKENALEIGLDIYDKNGNEISFAGLVDLFMPVGTITMRFDTTNPGTIYPGTTWTQITARVLRAGSAGQIGSSGTIADGTGRTYIDVAVWRRTA